MSSRFITLIPAFVVSGYFLAAMGLYLLKGATTGFPQDAETSKRSASKILGPFLRHYFMWVIAPWETVLVALGFTPNSLTLASLGLACASAVSLGTGYFALGGWLYLFAGILDIMDGRIARRTNRVTKAGAFFDSVIDRYAELVVFGGLAYFYRQSWVLWVTLAAAMGSVLVSYARARGESLGVDVKIGLMQRPERLFYLGITTAMSPILALFTPELSVAYVPVVAALILLAFSTNVTAIRRVHHTMLALDPPTNPIADSLRPIATNIVPFRTAQGGR